MKGQHAKISTHGVLFLIALYLFVFQIWAIWPFTVDDMYITLRYARHWSEGFGIVWNVGQPPVEGYSNFTFVLLARVALTLGLDPVVILKSAGIVGLLITTWMLYLINRLWVNPRLAIIPCFWLLAYEGQIIWSVSGLETTVYEAMISASLLFIFKGLGYSSYPQVRTKPRFRWIAAAGVLLAFASMTRPEAPALVLLFFSLIVVTQVSSKKNILITFSLLSVSFALIFFPYFIWRLYYYGRLFPNPVYCKGLTGEVFVLDKNYLKFIWPFALLSLPALWQSIKNQDYRHYFLWLPSFLYLILLAGADSVVAFDNRLFLPVMVLLLPLSLQGLIIIVQYVLTKNSKRFDTSIYLCAFMITILFVPMLSLTHYRHFTHNPLAGEQLRQKVLSWLQRNLPSGGTVVLGDSGFIPYKSPYQFIDSYCLNNREMTKITTPGMYQRFCDAILATNPDVLILTSLIENGKIMYAPADACLVQKLMKDDHYQRKWSISTGDKHSIYRYEIFSK